MSGEGAVPSPDRISDEEFMTRLSGWLIFSTGSPYPVIPVIGENGVIDREKMLNLPCFLNVPREGLL